VGRRVTGPPLRPPSGSLLGSSQSAFAEVRRLDFPGTKPGLLTSAVRSARGRAGRDVEVRGRRRCRLPAGSSRARRSACGRPRGPSR